jgi:hypothetical protein
MLATGKMVKLRNLVWGLVLLILLSACGAEKNSATPVPLQQQLRVSNTGSSDIQGLVVYFPGLHPEAEATKINYGDLKAGQTSAYQDVPTGVYAYAAYAYSLEGREVVQPVTDWVGEAPISGQKFTYQITLALQKPVGDQMRLIKVLVDEP